MRRPNTVSRVPRCMVVRGIGRHMQTVEQLEGGVRKMAASTSSALTSTAKQALRSHWPEYLIEAWALGMFMVSACVFGALLDHPQSPLHQLIECPTLRRAIGGIAMGLTAIGLICSPWGRRSGAHMNPSFTLSFFMLGKMEPWDALFYVCAQFTGGISGVFLGELLIGPPLRHSAVNYVVTAPGSEGIAVAFGAELLISFVMMTTVLVVSNSPRLSKLTPYFAGTLVATFILLEAPFSGMSMNPARTLGSAVPAQEWTALWLYFIAPPAGMLFAGLLYRYWRGLHRVFCAKFHHHNDERCIFRCNYAALRNNQ